MDVLSEAPVFDRLARSQPVPCVLEVPHHSEVIASAFVDPCLVALFLASARSWVLRLVASVEAGAAPGLVHASDLVVETLVFVVDASIEDLDAVGSVVATYRDALEGFQSIQRMFPAVAAMDTRCSPAVDHTVHRRRSR